MQVLCEFHLKVVNVSLPITALTQASNRSKVQLLKCKGSCNSRTHVDAKISGTSNTLTSTQPGLRAAMVDLQPVTKHKNWRNASLHF